MLPELAVLADGATKRAAGRRVPKGVVDRVIEDSPAAVAGIRPGDLLLAINGLVPRDIVDVRLDSAAPSVSLDVERGGTRVALTINKEPDEDLGIEFSSPAFDRMKTCNNACEFCFIRGLGPGLRRSLYIKDDDFRYSFLYGNFTTLTNLSQDEWQRILFQRLSPLQVSVHATDLDLRRELLRNPKAPDILQQLDELAPHDIRIHAQIVLIPGKNDGVVLERTIADLAARYPTVESMAVVPVGLTQHSRPSSIRPLEAADAAAVIRIVQKAQRAYRREWGVGFVYASDELYLLAGKSLPSARSYDDYPQFHNGVGLVQLFRSEWRRAARKLPPAVEPWQRVCWATGRLLAPILEELAADLGSVEGLHVDVVPMQNSLFGGAVTIAGLISGRDIVNAMIDRSCDRLILPRSMFDAAGMRTIDGWSVEDIANKLEVDVVIGESPKDLLAKTLASPSMHSSAHAFEPPNEDLSSGSDLTPEKELICAGS